MTTTPALLGLAVVLLGACARPAQPPDADVTVAPESTSSTVAAPAAPRAVPSGATLDIEVGSGSASYTVGNWRPVPFESQIIPAKGAMYAVDVRIVATRGAVPVNGFYFAVRTAEGGTVAPAVGAVRPGITYGRLAEGESMEGHVAFDLAPGTAVTGVLLRDPAGKQLALWSVS